jgi:hypothetical protein
MLVGSDFNKIKGNFSALQYVNIQEEKNYNCTLHLNIYFWTIIYVVEIYVNLKLMYVS